MKKIMPVITLILLLSICSVNSITTFVYNETNLVSLELEATDPDDERLVYTYSKPLNNKGEWQTNYGDAGEYTVTVTVSDGELSNSEDVLIAVKKKEEAPTIDNFKPNIGKIEVEEGKSLKFSASATDLNKDELSYLWFLNDKEISEGNAVTFSPNYGDSGDYKIKIVVSDGKNEAINEWDVTVNKVDINMILGPIEDVEVTETESVELSLPSLEEYGLSYRISEPIGDDNYWMTDYNSKGEYTVTVSVEGKGFFATKNIEVVVKNKDRPPEFNIQGLYFIKEDEDLKIELKAEDPDVEEIEFSADNLPKNSFLEDNIFEWKPGYDVVKKEGIFDYVLDKFHLLKKSFSVTFIAISEDSEVKKDIKIIVQDNNMPFVIEEFKPIEVFEGDIVKIEPKYNDPDDDRVSFTYSGWMNKNVHKTTYGDAGEYYVKVAGTDGYHTAYRFVKITVKKSNRAPVFKEIGNFEIYENQSLKIELNAEDPDGEEIEFSSTDLPSGSKLEKSIFTWNPDFDFINKEEGKKSIFVNFMASDGQEQVTKTATITINDQNRAPEILDVSGDTIAKVNKPVVFWVDAKDKDGDELKYGWAFSRLEKYEATAVMERTFKSEGNKKVKVIISDGIESVSYEWDVRVV